MNYLTIEVEKPKDKSMDAAIAAHKLESRAASVANGAYVTFRIIDCTPLEAFKIGKTYQHFISIV